jgi:hypothetical protein
VVRCRGVGFGGESKGCLGEVCEDVVAALGATVT